MKWNVNDINNSLAESCQKTCSSCCKLGLLFLPDAEYAEIVNWIKVNSPAELQTFLSRCIKHDGFYLYDQQQACQFLDEKNLCRLHVDKVKPTECFWWPLHVYANEDGSLEIRVSTSCCDGYKFINQDSSIIEDIKKVVDKWGKDIFIKFRKEYKGSYNNKIVTKI